MEGEYRQYDENGTLKTRALYAGGELSGTYKTYNEDGSCRMVEYRAGDVYKRQYYLVLHRHTSTFGDMDYDTPDGPVRLKKVLHEILDMLYERLERPQRVSEAIRRLKERGVDEQVIRECLKDL